MSFRIKTFCFSVSVYFLFFGFIGTVPLGCAGNSESSDFGKIILNKKVKAGYLYTTSDINYTPLIRSHGLNTLILKDTFLKERSLPNKLGRYRKWARVCRQENLHLFIAYNWQPEPEISKYRKVVYSDGQAGNAPCPRDKMFWSGYLVPWGKAIAELSKDGTLQVDGIFLDCELYGCEGDKCRYDTNTCFCDSCFSEYLFLQGYKASELPAVGYEARKQWLEKNNHITAYFSFLKSEVELLAQDYECQLHIINPALMIGFYPTPNGWALNSLAKGIGTPEMPMIIFATDTYEKGGAYVIPREPQNFYLSQGINSIYLAGFLLRKYSSESLKSALPDSCVRCGGYWLFKLPMLWEPPNQQHILADGTSKDYWDSIAEANKSIDSLEIRTNQPDHVTDILHGWGFSYLKMPAEGQIDYALPEVKFRGGHNFLIYGTQGKPSEFSLELKKLGDYTDVLKYRVLNSDDKSITSNIISSPGPASLRFTPSEDGVYLLAIDSGRNFFVIKSGNSPIAVLNYPGFHTIGRTSPLYFNVSNNEKVVIIGKGRKAKYVAVRVQDPKGMVYSAETEPADNTFRLEINSSQAINGIYSLRVIGRNNSDPEDANLHFLLPAKMCLSFNKNWYFHSE